MMQQNCSRSSTWTTTTTVVRVQKRSSTSSSSSSQPLDNSSSKRRKLMIKRRRTKSERNSRAGKMLLPTAKGTSVSVGPEQSVALDAEIDKFLEEKAIKNNLTATNVKSIIRHVITNNMVQKMIMSTVKKKGANPDDSSDDEACFEPKLTRARTKMLLGNRNTSPQLWPLASPAKPQPPVVSETHVLIHQELPEDSSGDEEYVPKEDETYSEDESSSVASHASDASSPQVVSKSSTRVVTRRHLTGLTELSSPNSNLEFKFKTPNAKPKCAKRLPVSAIGQRTRSKLPLNDTPLEDLEMQLNPPDITTDMYDWGIEDNEDYLGFLNDFLRPGQVVGSEINEPHDDEEADPEYNIMDDEEEHDKEELRRDRAVKVSKKELNELVANLLEESHFTSGDELDEGDFTSFCASQLSQLSHMSMSNFQERSGNDNSKLYDSGVVASESETTQKVESETPLIEIQEVTQLTPPPKTEDKVAPTNALNFVNSGIVEEPWFNENTRYILRNQLAQHLQFLSQTYALTATREEQNLKNVAQNAKRMIIEVRNLRILNGETSIVTAVPNTEAAWQFVNSWPLRSCPKSPIKKKILVEQYLNERETEWTEACGKKLAPNYFPRDVAKAILENAAFMFPNLLPTYYDQSCARKLPFVPSEDILLIYGVEQLKEHNNLSWKEKATVIADHILTSRSAECVYNRIRNLRKKNAPGLSQTVKNYFELGTIVIESPQILTPDVAVAPIHQPKEIIPRLWWTYISNLLMLPQESRNPGRPHKPRQNKRKNSNLAGANTSISAQRPTNQQFSSAECITSTFPYGISAVQQKIADNPDLAAIPVMNVHGHPEVYMFVPKYALPATGYNTSPKGTESNTLSKFYHPIPMYNHQPSSDSEYVDKKGQENSPLKLTAVGKPFSLPELLEFKNDVIELSALNTPLKNAVMEKVESFKTILTSNKNTEEDDIQTDTITRQIENCRERVEHSARTFGNFKAQVKVGHAEDADQDVGDSVCGTGPEPPSGSSDSSSSSSSDDSESSSSSSSDDEDEMSTMAAPLVVTLDSDVETASGFVVGEAEAGDEFSMGETNKPTDNGDKPDNCDQHQKANIQNDEPQSLTTERNDSTEGNQFIRKQGGNDEDDEDDEDKPTKSSTTPEDAGEDELDKEDDTEDDVEPETASKKFPPPAEAQSKRKSSKRSSTSPAKKRSKGAPVEVLLEEDAELDQEVAGAYMETFMGKIKTASESTHPGLYNEFIKFLGDAGETDMHEEEIITKAKFLLKDFPQIFAEFSTFLPRKETEHYMEPDDEADFNEREDIEAQLNFIRNLEKFTEKSPQLKAKILHKFKVLKDDPDLSEKDLADALTPFFQGNSMMLSAFQALYPSVYLPGSVDDTNNFEEIHMENENFTTAELGVEIVSLPEEKNIPATSTCPCSCHSTTTHAYVSRMKHCSKCCIKFQDGKVFVHSSRLVKPVNVELTSPSAAKKMFNQTDVINTSSTLNSQTHGSSNKVDIPRDETDLKKSRGLPADSEYPDPASGNKSNKPSITGDLEEGELADEEESEKVDNPVSFNQMTSIIDPQTRGRQYHNIKSTASSYDSSTIVNLKRWTLEEDSLLLTAYQSDSSSEETFVKLNSLLPHRDRTEIESRYVELMSLLQQKMGNTGEDDKNTKEAVVHLPEKD